MRTTTFLIGLLVLALLAAACGAPAAPQAAESNPLAVQAEGSQKTTAAVVLSPDTQDQPESDDEAETEEAIGEEAVSEEETPKSRTAVYGAVLPAASSPGRLILLLLGLDNIAELSTDYLNGEPPILEDGTWEANEDGTLTVTLTGQADQEYDEPVVINFQETDGELISIDADPEVYGEEGLELTRLTLEQLSQLSASRAYLDLDLAAGFALDPFFVSVNGGGHLDASKLVEGCSGFIHPNPVVTLDWEGDAEFVEAFFLSDHDPTLIIQIPDGTYMCNDDANPQLLDPVIQMDEPQNGRYNIWVGSYEKDQLLPGILVLTTRPEINIGSFSLESLIQREAVPEVLPEPEPRVELEVVTEVLDRYEGEVGLLEDEELTQEVTTEGTIAAFDLPVEGLRCHGFVSEVPDYVFDWEGDTESVRVFFESDVDAALLVVVPDGRILCTDDAEAAANLNPLVTVAEPAEGRYGVFVGRFDVETPLSGTITVAGTADSEPDVLEPVQQ